MSVRFKFKNDLEHTALPVDGFHISVIDLKRAIVRLKKLGKTTDFDLEVTNQQDNKLFDADDALIPKNSTLVIVRKPLPKGQQRVWEEEKSANMGYGSSGGGGGLGFVSEAKDMTEDDRLDAMMSNSSEMYDQKNWVKYRGRQLLQGKIPPPTYRCNRCNKPGHWNFDCEIGSGGSYGLHSRDYSAPPDT